MDGWNGRGVSDGDWICVGESVFNFFFLTGFWDGKIADRGAFKKGFYTFWQNW